MTQTDELAQLQLAGNLRALQGDGITACKAGFTRAWVEALREDMMAAFWEAIHRPGGAVPRGPRRWYVEAHPQAFRGFAQLVTHPWVVGMCEAVLGPNYEIVEIGLDVPFQGAKVQPWHRDFPLPHETFEDRRITSLAFNLTGVDVTPDMGPLEVAHGTQWEAGSDWRNGMFPPASEFARYEQRAVRKFAQAGDIMLTRDFHDALPPLAPDHLVCRVVDKLQPITQKHQCVGQCCCSN